MEMESDRSPGRNLRPGSWRAVHGLVRSAHIMLCVTRDRTGDLRIFSLERGLLSPTPLYHDPQKTASFLRVFCFRATAK